MIRYLFLFIGGVHTACFCRLCGVVAWAGAVRVFAGFAGRGVAAARVSNGKSKLSFNQTNYSVFV